MYNNRSDAAMLRCFKITLSERYIKNVIIIIIILTDYLENLYITCVLLQYLHSITFYRTSCIFKVIGVIRVKIIFVRFNILFVHYLLPHWDRY